MRRWIVAIAVLIALAAALAACRDRHQPDVYITALQPLDDGSAIVIYTGRKQQRIARVEITGRMTWSSPLAGKPVTIAPYNGISISDDIVTVRYAHMRDSDPTDHALAGFSLKNGALVWDTILTPYRPAMPTGGLPPETPTYTIALPLAQGLIAQWADDGTSTWLFAVDARTGRIVSKQPAQDLASPNVIGARIIVNEVDQTVVFDATGAAPPQQLSSWYRGCSIDGEYVTLTYETMEGDRSLVALRDGDPSTRRVIAAGFPPKGYRAPRLLSCGRYRDRLVLLVRTGFDGNNHEQTQVWILDAQGTLLHAINLGADMNFDTYSIREEYPHAAPLSGELTRFAPYMQRQNEIEGDGKTRLLMLDLESGKIAWSGPADAIEHLALFRAGQRWYAFESAVSPILSAFDGRTGELIAAVRLFSPRGLGDIWPYHVMGDRVWAFSGAWGAASSPSIAVLDATNLATVFQRGIDLEDVTIAMRERLQLVPSNLRK